MDPGITTEQRIISTVQSLSQTFNRLRKNELKGFFIVQIKETLDNVWKEVKEHSEQNDFVDGVIKVDVLTEAADIIRKNHVDVNELEKDLNEIYGHGSYFTFCKAIYNISKVESNKN